jgi:putative restriction endonuclease
VQNSVSLFNEFASNRDDLLFESERILAELENQSIESKYAESLKDISELKGETKVREVKTRMSHKDDNDNIKRGSGSFGKP